LLSYKTPKVVAEIGCNHKGDLEIAKEMIKTAAIFCCADLVKFQKRNPRELLSEAEYNAPHPNPGNAYGSTYGAHREFLEFNIDQHRELKKYCEKFGIGYSCSVWDLTSAREIAAIEPTYIKIPSAVNTNFKLLEWLCDNYSGDLHISTGMTTLEELDNLFKFLVERRKNYAVVLYACVSGYPVPFEDVSLLEVTRLKEKYGEFVKGIGFSGHHLGIAVDMAAYTLGAEWLERHFTLDRTWKGTDHAASLEPDGLRRVVRDLKAVRKSLNYKENELLEIEKPQRAKLKYKGSDQDVNRKIYSLYTGSGRK